MRSERPGARMVCFTVFAQNPLEKPDFLRKTVSKCMTRSGVSKCEAPANSRFASLDRHISWHRAARFLRANPYGLLLSACFFAFANAENDAISQLIRQRIDTSLWPDEPKQYTRAAVIPTSTAPIPANAATRSRNRFGRCRHNRPSLR
ncbi:hypothetical protein [Burkholderia gladioli]|uniref:hypothetical protein n=1 Tax=Burkholderia gladioli TaxID=28095 RepID=UPI001641A4CF|nr:hypothetical protein [Burkholderia gladioli]